MVLVFKSLKHVWILFVKQLLNEIISTNEIIDNLLFEKKWFKKLIFFQYSEM